jgi:hypothetical protein
MSNLNRPRPHATAPARARRLVEPERRPAHRPSASLVSEAVVAGYIHDISQRHRHGIGGGGRDRRAELRPVTRLETSSL